MTLSFQSFLMTVSLLSLALVIVYIVRLNWVLIRKRTEQKSKRILSLFLQKKLTERESRWCHRHWLLILDRYIELSQSLGLEEEEQKRVQDLLRVNRGDIYFVRRLSSRRIFQRCRAARYLGYIHSSISQNALINHLLREKRDRVNIYVLHSLSILGSSQAIPNIIDSLKGSSSRYIRQVSGVLQNFRSSFIALFPILSVHEEREVQEVIIDFAKNIPSNIFGPYLLKIFSESGTTEELKLLAFEALIDSYPHVLNPIHYITHESEEIRKAAIMGLGNHPSEEAILELVELLGGESTDFAVKSLSNIIKKGTAYFLFLNERLLNEKRPAIVSCLITVISNRIDYYLPLLGHLNAQQNGLIIGEVLKSGRVSNIISFLNENHDKEIEDILLTLIKRSMREDKIETEEFQIYLKESLLTRLGLSQLPIPQMRVNDKNEGVKPGPLYVILFFVLTSLTYFFVKSYWLGGDLSQWAYYSKRGLNEYLLIFGYYCLGLNFLYYLLFVFSFLNSRSQSKYWKIKDDSFLFTQKMLPSLSILVPAYCEEGSVVDNVLSLLNLRYPDYEVIVVNDGSKDRTLQVLIEYFSLEKEDMVYDHNLQTQPVRGIYKNKNIPELTVIDKINGGKADSLNVGLNLASKEYFAGIDSDSLLERDALLILTSAFLDQDHPVAAAGGNIMPVNGCRVDRGVLEDIHLPSHPIALLQNIEYIRSFMNGRMGWAYMKTLLIISGAFGVFRREDVIRIKGYLTSREMYLKDTVGEDMELVVRLSRNLKERKEPYSLLYLFLANCWTEVPQSLTILRKQRERWQRGLIDILSFHKKMIFNPHYGSIGLIGFPYYLLAEVIGPWFEVIANLFFFLGIVTGWVTLPILMLVLGANFVLSFSLSLSSMIIMDWDGSLFSWKDRIVLVITSLLETLGFRQLVSFYRISGFIGVLRNITGWGTMTRSGFKKKGA
jgi:peptidoglycan-N-acetylglucosamine deacetylase